MEKSKNYSSDFIVGGLDFLKVPRCAYQVRENGDIVFFPNRAHCIEFHFITAVEAPIKEKIAETLKESVKEISGEIKHFQFKECFNQIPESEQEIYNFLFELSHAIDEDKEPKSHYRFCMSHLCNFIALLSGFLYRVSENGLFLDGFTEPIIQCVPLLQSYKIFYDKYLFQSCTEEIFTEKARRCFDLWRRVLTCLKSYL